MIPPLRRWGASQLLGAWVAYWVALAVVVFWRPALVAWRISRLPDGRAKATAGFSDGKFGIDMVVDNVTTYHGQAGYGAVFFWLLVPPLLIWLVWLVARPRPTAAAAARPSELSAGDPLAGHDARPRESAERQSRVR